MDDNDGNNEDRRDEICIVPHWIEVAEAVTVQLLYLVEHKVSTHGKQDDRESVVSSQGWVTLIDLAEKDVAVEDESEKVEEEREEEVLDGEFLSQRPFVINQRLDTLLSKYLEVVITDIAKSFEEFISNLFLIAVNHWDI